MIVNCLRWDGERGPEVKQLDRPQQIVQDAQGKALIYAEPGTNKIKTLYRSNSH